ncbi:MAG: cation transporter [Actinobacteria bacterium]|nr:cation transporter [Actinomycetota bacterium]
MENIHSGDMQKSTRTRLILAILISIAFVVAEVIIGVVTGSLSLISDAGHNATDCLAMGLSLFAIFMMARDPTPRRTYGYGRVGIVIALTNAMILVGVAGFLVYSSIRRIVDISPVSGPAISITAAAAFVINSMVALLLFRDRQDLNIKSALLHMVSDAGISLGVVIGGVFITFTDWYYADPIIALIISVFIAGGALFLTRDALNILLESVPKEIDIREVEAAMLEVDMVQGVHHIHIWELGSRVYALSGHVEVEDCRLSECNDTISSISEVLEKRFQIIHPTIQIECSSSCEEQWPCSRQTEDKQEH